MKRRITSQSILFFSLFTVCCLLSEPVSAASTITVSTTSDVVGVDGFCSLREAIIAANSDAAVHECTAGSGDDTIEFGASLPAPATFVLTLSGTNEDAAATGDLDLTGTVTINGDGQNNTIIDGDGIDRVLHIHPAARATINGVTVKNGDPGAGANGGGFAVEATGRLTVTVSTVISNTAVLGGGAYVLGGLTMNDSTVQMNQGGGLHNNAGLLTLGNVEVLNSTGGFGITNKAGGFLEYTNGRVSENNAGGIQNDISTANLSNLTIDLNSSGSGVHNKGASRSTLTVTNSWIHHNGGSSGAGIFNDGAAASATIENSRINNNIATAGGGGIGNTGTVILKSSTVDSNQAPSGGGIEHQGVSFQAENATISSNTATDNGGGIANQTSATLTNVTISGNGASGTDTGGNIYNDGDNPQISFVNSIVANPGAGGNCVNTVGALNSLGHNLESTTGCNFTFTGDMTNTNPLLGPLQNNGGPTPTHALQNGSPAIDNGDDTECPAADQRGVSRPLDGDANSTAVCDIGAYEAGTLETLLCGIEINTAYPLADLTVTITDLGTDLACIQVTKLPYDHPQATPSIQTGQYWEISGLQSDQTTAATPDYVFNLTLPHTVSPNMAASVCKYPGDLGGAGWDCGRTGSNANFVWRNGYGKGFSGWAVGDDSGPTALTLKSFEAFSAASPGGMAPIFLVAFIVFTFALMLSRRRRHG